MKKLLIVVVVLLVFACVSAFAQQSLTPDAAVKIALNDNRELAAVRMRVEEAKARLVQAGLLPNPELEVEGKFDIAFKSESKQTFSIGIVQPFSVGGRIAAQKDVARFEIERAIAEAADLERRIVGEVRRAFTELFTADEQIKLQEFLIGLNEELLRATKAALVRGQVSEKDVNATQIALQQARQRQKVLETQRRSRLLELNKLQGKPAEFDFIAAGRLEAQALPELSAFVLEKTLERRPDYIAAQIDAALARSEQRLTKAEQFETWRIGVGYERDYGSQDNSLEQFIGLKLSIPLPLFDKKQGRILETLAKEERAQKTAEALRFQISHELADALNRVKSLASLLESYSPGILKRAESNVKLVENGYRRGLTGITEVIQSRQQFAELKSSYIELLAEYQRAVIDLEIAAGIFPGIARLKLVKEVNYSEKINK
ncbi:MAG: TolC family protein [Nitrospirota bacterium]